MSLNEFNVQRTWRSTQDGMAYRMAVKGLGNELVTAEIVVHNVSNRHAPSEYIEYELQAHIIGHVRKALFPKS
jgi:hypothetical protein